ncbi:AfsR/SARP family transcriptional regulator [Streptomyces bacillaris]|uniref:AfsR/SARP family transcriptional regulator n=1 Tax=Streptomyces bacillaris TaxID=68179 RepID=UPI0034616ECB
MEDAEECSTPGGGSVRMSRDRSPAMGGTHSSSAESDVNQDVPSTIGDPMRFSFLGPFEITVDDGRPFTLRSPKVRQVLTLLLVQPNDVVPVETLMKELWGENPPRSSLTTLQTYIYHARKAFAREGASAHRELLVTSPPGYRMDVQGHEVDGIEFEELVNRGRVEFREGEDERASRHLRKALGMCRGRILANIETGEVLAAHVAYLEELRLRATELAIEAEIRLGRHRELIPELRTLVKEHPLNEWFHAQLISILGVSGRRGEALKAYQDLRGILDDELGLEPSDELQRLQYEVLNSKGTPGSQPLPVFSAVE